MLEALGLTTYENDAYTTLLSLGESDARTIANHSGVPFGRIYDILSLLESKELILVQPSRPKKFRPISPDVAVSLLMDQKRADLKELEKTASEIENELSKLYNPASHDDLFWKVGIGDDLIPSYIEMMKQTEEELLGYVELHPSLTLNDIDFFFEVLKELLSKGVRIQVLVGTDQPDKILDIIDQYQEAISSVKIKYCNPLSEPFNILDNSKVILKVRNPIDPRDDFAFVYVWDNKFATKLRKIYRELWNKAAEF